MGLELIAEGLDRYWDVLPPLRAEETDAHKRFMVRLMALTELGATNRQCKLGDLVAGGRNVTDLRADLDKALARVPADAAMGMAVTRACDAAHKSARIFQMRFGEKHDPQFEFEVMLEKLVAFQQHFVRGAITNAGFDEPPRPTRQITIGAISSRADVVRALDLVLAYYEDNEPSSPVPMLVNRAKRLVSLSFSDAMRELAPSGLKELQTATGMAGDKKQAQ